MKSKSLASLFLIPFLVCMASAQEVNAPRLPNVHRIAKAWNSISEETQQWNQSMARAEALLRVRFGNQVLDLNEERKQELETERRKSCVRHYKAAREATIKQLEALNTLIEEEDY